eukprot:sb/3462845/
MEPLIKVTISLLLCYRWHQGKITKITKDSNGTKKYSGHHTKGAEDGKWVTYKDYEYTFSDYPLEELRCAPNIFDILQTRETSAGLAENLTCDVYISYCPGDSEGDVKAGLCSAVPGHVYGELVDPIRLKTDLERAGYKVLSNIRNHHNNELDLNKIVTAIKNCKVFVSCISNEYALNDICRMELQYAKKTAGKALIPVICGPGGGEMSWQSNVVGMLIAGELYIDFRWPDVYGEKMDSLKSQVERGMRGEITDSQRQPFIATDNQSQSVTIATDNQSQSVTIAIDNQNHSVTIATDNLTPSAPTEELLNSPHGTLYPSLEHLGDSLSRLTLYSSESEGPGYSGDDQIDELGRPPSYEQCTQQGVQNVVAASAPPGAVVQVQPVNQERQHPKVFVSYCWSNSNLSYQRNEISKLSGGEWNDPRLIKEHLSKKFPVWLDIEQLTSGQVSGMFEQITTGLVNSKVVCVFVSAEYAKSENCKMEFQFAAKSLRKPFIPICVGENLDWQNTVIGALVAGSGTELFDMTAVTSEGDMLKHVERIIEKVGQYIDEPGGATSPAARSTASPATAPPSYESAVSGAPQVGDHVISHHFKHAYFTATILSFNREDMTYHIEVRELLYEQITIQGGRVGGGLVVHRRCWSWGLGGWPEKITSL